MLFNLCTGDHGCASGNGGCSEICVLTETNGTRKCLCNDYYKLDTGSDTRCVDSKFLINCNTCVITLPLQILAVM